MVNRTCSGAGRRAREVPDRRRGAMRRWGALGRRHGAARRPRPAARRRQRGEHQRDGVEGGAVMRRLAAVPVPVPVPVPMVMVVIARVIGTRAGVRRAETSNCVGRVCEGPSRMRHRAAGLRLVADAGRVTLPDGSGRVPARHLLMRVCVKNAVLQSGPLRREHGHQRPRDERVTQRRSSGSGPHRTSLVRPSRGRAKPCATAPMQPARPALQPKAAASACSRSACRSSTASRPIEKRTSVPPQAGRARIAFRS